MPAVVYCWEVVVKEFVRVEMKTFVCGLEVKDGKVVKAAPVMRWSVGKELEEVLDWITKRGGNHICLAAGITARLPL